MYDAGPCPPRRMAARLKADERANALANMDMTEWAIAELAFVFITASSSPCVKPLKSRDIFLAHPNQKVIMMSNTADLTILPPGLPNTMKVTSS